MSVLIGSSLRTVNAISYKEQAFGFLSPHKNQGRKKTYLYPSFTNKGKKEFIYIYAYDKMAQQKEMSLLKSIYQCKNLAASKFFLVRFGKLFTHFFLDCDWPEMY